MQNAVNDPAAYATSFGYAGTYWDYVRKISAERKDIKELINLHITEEEVTAILKQAGFHGYRLGGAAQWIIKTISMINAL